jgi:hypothetical protein
MPGRRCRIVVTLLLAAFSACGNDDEQRTIAPTVTPTSTIASPREPTPTSTMAATGTSTSTMTDGTPTSTVTPTPTPTGTPIDATRFIGVYGDASGVPETQFGVPAVAIMTGTDEELTLVIAFDGHTMITLTGMPRSDGTVDLSGGGVVEDDELIMVEGTATLSEAEGIQRIVCEFHDRSPLGFSATVAFRRPATGTPPLFAGSYRFTFLPSPSGCDCTTTAVITINVDADGFGQSVMTAEERDVGGAVLGSFDAGECFVAAIGTVRCQLLYRTTFPTPPSGIPPVMAFGVTLTGRLVAGAGGVTGSGRTEAPIFPEPVFLGGDWTATSVRGP